MGADLSYLFIHQGRFELVISREAHTRFHGIANDYSAYTGIQPANTPLGECLP